ncbi:MAG: exonuclease subunit SbcD [Pseudanabaenaceae cyanobacterium bins.68]|nr:exonuclease subunit SbcD [Pseudanabaenaceae cyanobacterium bins.68]
MIKVLHFADIHLGTLTHGKVNPQTGINSRLEDFERCLQICIDRAVDQPADIVLFGGDAFPDATPSPQVQQLFASQFRRLADAEIPTVLLIGNHDRHSQASNSLDIFRSLAVPGFVVGDRLQTHKIATRNGEIQVTCLPWLTRSTLLTKAETDGLSLEAVGKVLLDRLHLVLEAEIRQLDPEIPAILLAHAMVDRATMGAERFLAAGTGFTLPLNLLARPEFSYVALGHVHKHQVLHQDPPVVYPGSIERVDFGEEHEAKGYMWVEIDQTKCEFHFCALPARPFITITADLSQLEQPHQAQAQLLAAIAQADIPGAIARLVYKIKPEHQPLLDLTEIHHALAITHTYTISPQIAASPSRLRLGNQDLSPILNPYAALQLYLNTRPDLQAQAPELLAAAQALLEDQPQAGEHQLQIALNSYLNS